LLKEISTNINKENLEILTSSCLFTYILENLNVNLLIIKTNINLYTEIFEILDKLILFDNLDNEFINCVFKNINNYYSECDDFLNSKLYDDENEKQLCLKLIKIFEMYSNKCSLKKLSVGNDEMNEKEKYKLMVYDNIFSKNGNKIDFKKYKAPKNHRMYKYKDTKYSRKVYKRIMSELLSLKGDKTIPIEWESSILMKIDFENLLITFIITGPDETPYHNGIFVFHCCFPDNYPMSPPKVLIDNTNNNKFRWNPNLYAEGKVCLSLLGTWHADSNESWIPGQSTLLQVITSIQCMILGVSEPYFNEPGYEDNKGTKKGERNSKLYNDKIQYYNCYMINKMIKEPPHQFEDFTKNHFLAKEDIILKNYDNWSINNEYKDKIIKEKKIFLDSMLELKEKEKIFVKPSNLNVDTKCQDDLFSTTEELEESNTEELLEEFITEETIEETIKNN
jgi:ubiquitin-protein ligase